MRIAVAYRKALKRIRDMSLWDRNYDACETAGVSIFKHLHARRRVNFLFYLAISQIKCLSLLRYYFRFNNFTAISTRLYLLKFFKNVDPLKHKQLCLTSENSETSVCRNKIGPVIYWRGERHPFCAPKYGGECGTRIGQRQTVFNKYIFTQKTQKPDSASLNLVR